MTNIFSKKQPYQFLLPPVKYASQQLNLSLFHQSLLINRSALQTHKNIEEHQEVVWAEQQVGDKRVFLDMFSERLKDTLVSRVSRISRMEFHQHPAMSSHWTCSSKRSPTTYWPLPQQHQLNKFN